MNRDEMDQRMAEADKELQEMAYAAMDRLYQAGARLDDIQLVGWLAGLSNWKPTQQKRAA